MPSEQYTKRDYIICGIIAAFVVFMSFRLSNDFRRHNLRAKQSAESLKEHAPGSPSNHLAGSISPYLLQHAYNPVNWYPWGPDAIKRAQKEHKVIFLSSGYLACHYCHLMEKESFDNDETARILNDNFICIKVDSEERPDIDATYQLALEILAGTGGWPLNVWLTPDLKPFHAAAYLRQGEFRDINNEIASSWNKTPQSIQSQAELLVSRMKQANARKIKATADSLTEIEGRAIKLLVAGIDRKYGGFSGSPKFVQAPRLNFLLDAYLSGGHTELTQPLTETLDKIDHSALRDQIGGGFHRYCADDAWRIPHFEKMLYDQAELGELYLRAGKARQRDDFTHSGRAALGFALKEMRSATNGAFYSSLDADSNGDEGAFYLWTRDEMQACLQPTTADETCTALGVTAQGNYRDGLNALCLVPTGITARASLPAGAIQKLANIRERRPHPAADTKVVAGTNGLMIAALARSYKLTGNADYLNAALTAATWITTNMIDPSENLMHEADGARIGTIKGFLDDYVYLGEGLLELYRATGDVKWLQHSSKLISNMSQTFWVPEREAFKAAATEDFDPISPSFTVIDSEIPSANAMAVKDIYMLTGLLRDAHVSATSASLDLSSIARKTLGSFSWQLAQSPESCTSMIEAARLQH